MNHWLLWSSIEAPRDPIPLGELLLSVAGRDNKGCARWLGGSHASAPSPLRRNFQERTGSSWKRRVEIRAKAFLERYWEARKIINKTKSTMSSKQCWGDWGTPRAYCRVKKLSPASHCQMSESYNNTNNKNIWKKKTKIQKWKGKVLIYFIALASKFSRAFVFTPYKMKEN